MGAQGFYIMHAFFRRLLTAPKWKLGRTLVISVSPCLIFHMNPVPHQDPCAEEVGRTLSSSSSCLMDDRSSGPRVFIWGKRAALPVCKDVAKDYPQCNVREPMEVKWFKFEAQRTGFKWSQIAFGPDFGVARNDAGCLYVWGSFYMANGEHHSLPPTAMLFEHEPDVCFQDVQCSESSIWALTPEGKVVIWEGIVDEMAMHIANEQDESPIVGGKYVSGMDDHRITVVSVGISHAAFLTSDGQVYCLGSNEFGESGVDPQQAQVVRSCHCVRFPRFALPVLDVRCGKRHTIALASDDQIYSWGDDSKIQLGLGDSRSAYGDERKHSGSRGYINKLQTGEPMVASGAFGGGLKRSGSFSGAKYGEFESHHQFKPQRMPPIPLEFSRQVHGTPYPPPDGLLCGDDFTCLAVRDSPDHFSPEEDTIRLFCCGENGRGQCGRSLQCSQQTFGAVRLPKNSKLIDAACGSSHCLALVRQIGHQTRELWTWGSNNCGQTGKPKGIAVCPSARLRVPSVRIHALSCGFSNSALICSTRLNRTENEINPPPDECFEENE